MDTKPANNFKLRYAMAGFLATPLALTIVAALTGGSLILWLLIGLGFAAVNCLTTYILKQSGQIPYEW